MEHKKTFNNIDKDDELVKELHICRVVAHVCLSIDW